MTTTRSGKLWFAASPEDLHYDEDGNLTSDGRWSYQWDGENRLKAMETLPTAVTAGVLPQRLEFAYDAQGRRVRKAVISLSSTTQTLEVTSDLRILYDGWNLMAEFAVPSQYQIPNLKSTFAWGRDLSGTMQGAGGVGGLVLTELQSTIASEPSTTVAPCYDGNGNITAYVNLANGAVLSKHDYDPFGRPVWTELDGGNGTRNRCPFGFSTKYEDVETGLVYYGYRYYSTELGRWLSRDSICENGGINLYSSCRNDPITSFDSDGRQQVVNPGPTTAPTPYSNTPSFPSTGNNPSTIDHPGYPSGDGQPSSSPPDPYPEFPDDPELSFEPVGYNKGTFNDTNADKVKNSGDFNACNALLALAINGKTKMFYISTSQNRSMGVLAAIPKNYKAYNATSRPDTPGIKAARGKAERGHLIGDQFGGPAGLGNMATMESSFNDPTYKTGFEQNLKTELSNSKCGVCAWVIPLYGWRKPVPSAFETMIVNPSSIGGPPTSKRLDQPRLTGDLRLENVPWSRFSNNKGNDDLN